jgi:hypothetical protein
MESHVERDWQTVLGPAVLPGERCAQSVQVRPHDFRDGVHAPWSVSTGWSARLAAYWSARDRFLEVGRDVVPTRDAGRMLAQVREPLLGVLRISPDFRPAYDPLLRMANALSESGPAAARALLAELAHVHPTVTAEQ